MRKIRKKLKAEDLVPQDSDWMRDLGSRSRGRHSENNEIEDIKIKQEVEDDAMDIEEIQGK